jgi:hypothetical protein
MNTQRTNVSTPAVIKPRTDLDVRGTAGQISSAIRPILHEVAPMLAAGSAIAAAVHNPALLDSAEKLKDFGGLAEPIAHAVHSTERAQGAGRALDAAAKHARVAGQIGFDLARTRREIGLAEQLATRLKSPAAESALVFMRPSLHRLQSDFERERYFVRRYREIARQLKGADSSMVGKAALEVEKIAEKSVIGRTLLSAGRILVNPLVAKALLVVGVGVAGIKGYEEAPTDARAWKVAHGIGAGASSFVADAGMGAAILAGRANPAAALFDPAVKYGAKAVGLGDAGDKITIGKFYEGCSKSIIGFTQGFWTGDSAALSEVHKHNMSLSGSTVLRGYAMIGDVLSRSSVLNAAEDRIVDWYKNVPQDMRTSSSFWEALKQDTGSIGEVGKGLMLTIKDSVSSLKK